MDSSVKCWRLAVLLSALLLYCIEGTSGDAVNGTGISSLGLERDSSYVGVTPGIHPSLLEKGTLEGEGDSARKPISEGQESFSDNKTLRETRAKRLKRKPPTDHAVSATTGAGGLSDFSDLEATVKYHSSEIKPENKESPICVGCGGQGDTEVKSLLAEHKGAGVESVTSLVWPVRREAGDVGFKKKFGKGDGLSVTESQEDSGSGDAHVRVPAGPTTQRNWHGSQWGAVGDFLNRATASPSRTENTWSKGLLSASTEKAISPDSAEIDHLLQVSGETVLQSPSPSVTESQKHNVETGRSESQGVQGSSDTTMVTKNVHQNSPSPSASPVGPLKPSDPPPHHLVTEDDYFYSLDIHRALGHLPGSSFTGGDSTKSLHNKKSHWPRPDLYEDMANFDESYFYPTTSFYVDGDEEGGIEGEDDDDDDDTEETDDMEDDLTARELELGKAAKEATPMPKIPTITLDEKPTSQLHIPHQTFIGYGGELHPKFHPDINKDLTQMMSGTNENGTECKNGYIRRNNSCKSLCEIYPTYCYNGGQCYIVESTGAFCRCNTQDYIWHKGLRCESIITDFQVMCVAVGTAALVVLLLFMMTVFFAKKLYLLKTENYKLRKRNRYRTPSELHNDNFSLSTIAEGSHPNVRKLYDTPCNLSPHARALAYYDNLICQEDPNASHKVQDLPKACLKDEEPFNIQNSLSPKHEIGKGDPDIVDVNCVLNNLT
ncbi:chondroitin sulfate proteoglycan 5 [Pelodytes ibericus]